MAHVTDLEDPRLEPFREIRNRTWTHSSGWFIAEGPLLVRRLLDSTYATQCLLVDSRYAARYAHMAGPDVELLTMDSAQLSMLTGFHFHRGILGCGLRKPLRNVPSDFGKPPHFNETLVAAVGIEDQENLGSILRSCAALGVQRVLIGPGTCDPFARRAFRVSMGTTLQLDLFQATDIVADIEWLKTKMSVQCVATSLAEDSQPLEAYSRSGPCLLLFGSERDGLPAEIQQNVDGKVRIDMCKGVDSLNVGVAAGIVLYYFCKLAGR